MKTNYDVFMQQLHTVEGLVEVLSHLFKQCDDSPWDKWFNEKYCKNCGSISCDVDTARNELGMYSFYGTVTCAYCELHHNCKFFPHLDHIPDTKEVLTMWLRSEVDDSATDN